LKGLHSFKKLNSFYAHAASTAASAGASGAAGAAGAAVPRTTLAGFSPSAAVNSVTLLETLS